MDILLDQLYEINNLITQSSRFTVREFQKALLNISSIYKDYSINNGEYVITTTRSLEVVNGEQIMVVEILLPVFYRIPVEDPYVFKNIVRITNALYAKVEEVANLQNALNEVNQYILDNKLQPITTAYLVQSKKENKPCVEIYIGLDPNIL